MKCNTLNRTIFLNNLGEAETILKAIKNDTKTTKSTAASMKTASQTHTLIFRLQHCPHHSSPANHPSTRVSR